jgi:hypothetical protein
MVDDLIARFEYVADDGDTWHIMRDSYRGDCEDFALTALYLLEGKSLLRFWWALLSRRAKICRVTNGGTGHAVLRYEGQYIDNWTLAFVDRAHMEGLGHKFSRVTYLPYQVALKLLAGIVQRRLNKQTHTG